MAPYDPGRAPLLGYSTFVLLRDLINAYSGIYYEDDKVDLLADKLAGRLLELGLGSFQEYYHYLRYDPAGQGEWPALMDAITVQESYFFREVEQLRAFAEILVPQFKLAHRGSRVTVWSAACAAGEEPYSLAMLMLARDDAEGVDIVGTDISRRALERASRGVYPERSLRATPREMVKRYFRRHPAGWEVLPEVRDRVSFRQMNLLNQAAMRMVRGMDAIFCRNAFIYFDRAGMQKVVDHFYTALNPGGYLFVGAAESLLRLSTQFTLVEVGDAFAYRKVT